MDGSEEHAADHHPDDSGQPSPVKAGDYGPDDRRCPRDGGEMVPEQNGPMLGGYIIDAVVHRYGWGNFLFIKPNPLLNFTTVEDVSEQQQKNRNSHNGKRIHMIVSFVICMPHEYMRHELLSILYIDNRVKVQKVTVRL